MQLSTSRTTLNCCFLRRKPMPLVKIQKQLGEVGVVDLIDSKKNVVMITFLVKIVDCLVLYLHTCPHKRNVYFILENWHPLTTTLQQKHCLWMGRGNSKWKLAVSCNHECQGIGKPHGGASGRVATHRAAMCWDGFTPIQMSSEASLLWTHFSWCAGEPFKSSQI